jgi:hypothetical protein
MAVTKGNGFPFWAQPAHCRFVSIARSIPLRVAHPPPWLCPTGFVCPSGSALASIGDVCPDAPY